MYNGYGGAPYNVPNMNYNMPSFPQYPNFNPNYMNANYNYNENSINNMIGKQIVNMFGRNNDGFTREDFRFFDERFGGPGKAAGNFIFNRLDYNGRGVLQQNEVSYGVGMVTNALVAAKKLYQKYY